MSVTSADPAHLDAFVTGSARLRGDLASAAGDAQGAYVAFLATGSARQGCLGGLGALVVLLGELATTESFVAGVCQALVAADGSGHPGATTVADSAVAACLPGAAAGAPGHLVVAPSTLLGAPPMSGFADDPVHALTGNFYHPEVDLAFPGRSAVLDFGRAYNSLAAGRAGAFGPGWTSLLDVALAAGPDGGARVLLADGAEMIFSPDGGGGRAGMRLSRGEDGAWHLATGPQAGLDFGPGGALDGLRRGRGVVALTRDADGRVTRLEEALSGRWVRLAWEGDRVVSATASDSREVAYDYDGGHLVGVRRPAGGVTYRIDAGLLASVTDADGVVMVANTYDDEGRVATQTSPFGRVSAYTYGPAGTTVVRDQAGLRNLFIHDRRGNCTALVDGEGRALRLAYDAEGHKVGWRDRRGALWEIEWSGNRPVARRGPLGVEERFAFDDQDRIVAWTSPTGTRRWSYQGARRTPSAMAGPGGGVTTVEVSADDLPVALTDPDGVRVALAYDADGQVISVTDALGNTSRLSYDAAGHLASWRLPSSITASFQADEAGRVLSAVTPGSRASYSWSPAGRPEAGVDPREGAWRSSFGGHGALASTSDALGEATSFAYDTSGNLVSITGPDARVYRQGFDTQCALVSMTDPAGATWSCTRDGEGAVVSVVDPVGRERRAVRDALGRVVAEVDPSGRATERHYGPDGRLVRVVDPSGAETTFAYDAHGHVASIGDGAGPLAEYSWSAAGRLMRRRLASGAVTEYRYDEAGRLAGISEEDGSIAFVLDVDGRVVRATDDRGRAVVLSRDAAGRVVSATDRRGVEHHLGVDGAGRVTSFGAGGAGSSLGFDERGLLTSAVDALGAVTGFGHDPAGRLASVRDALGGLTSFGYDPAGRLGEVTDALGTTTRLRRDASGALTGLELADGSATELIRDTSGILLGVRRSGGPGAGMPVRFPRDAAGRLAGLPGPRDLRPGRRPEAAALPVDGGGRVSASPGGDLFRHDAAGQLVEWVAPGALPVVYAYDAGGRLVSERQGSSLTRWFHDAGGRLTRRVGVQGEETAYTYDAAGRRVREVSGDGGEVAYRWDAAGRLVGISREGRSVDVEVDGLGLPVSVGGVGVAWDRSSGWPAPSRIGEVAYERSATAVAAVHPDGRHEELAVDWAGSAGGQTDPWGVPLRDAGVPGPELGLGYRGELAVGGLVWLGARVYDPDTRSFLSPDPLPNPAGKPCSANPYHYAWNDPVSLVDPAGLRPLTQVEFEAIKRSWELGSLGKAWHTVGTDAWGGLEMGIVAAAGVGLLFVPGGDLVGAAILIGMATSSGVGLATGSFNPRGVAIAGIAAGAGAATGSLAGGFAPIVDNVVQGAVQAGSVLATQAVEGAPLNWRPAALAFATVGVGDGESPTSLSLAEEANSGSHSIEVATEGARSPWLLTEEKASETAQGGPFNTKFYKDPQSNVWWTKDVAGHGGSAFKIYKPTAGGLQWTTDADQFGDYLPNKWKGSQGRFIPWSQLRRH